ncbi:geranylgeranyl transferase type-2 subunit beta [Cryptococcus wingfieldii CBS 7118]|uniref:Geranylgeranyl transferase type-2 subunit beta n=1 Tax=Cryptococcus wingfieldii CBS 7118 TaxID=1295528 RepID=A0A1E3J6Q5_9TREE|nr:geranylgeranyl transferase type-2 subunit beta [Cryptococcus wingfieldii CBS 7118]ODN95776.1 geranylgeranyl transferase type-2 subunit beta [Cryptococcus wingfieldii CBS 7118]
MSSSASIPPLNIPLHVKYIQDLDKKQDLAYHLTSHLRLNGIYWGLTALYIMGQPEALDREGVIQYVLSCWDDKAGTFGPHPDHDGHILATLSGIQVLLMQDALDRADVERITSCNLINADGSVRGDPSPESDSRFTYILLSSLSLMSRLHLLTPAQLSSITSNIEQCKNFDGGFGLEPGTESHSGQVWVCTAALAILGRMDLVEVDLLGAWLSERQLPNGGLNGRPEKLEDVCYSWWCLASISIIGKIHWINAEKLTNFILSAQDPDEGGIGDRPGNWVDVFHTLFGVAGLSLLGYPGLQDIDPVYCMPADLIDRLGLRKAYSVLPRQSS